MSGIIEGPGDRPYAKGTPINDGLGNRTKNMNLVGTLNPERTSKFVWPYGHHLDHLYKDHLVVAPNTIITSESWING
jgi:hypothetical protein